MDASYWIWIEISTFFNLSLVWRILPFTMNTSSQTINFHQTLHLLVIIERQKRLYTLSNLILYLIKQYQRNDEHRSLSRMRAIGKYQLSRLDREKRHPWIYIKFSLGRHLLKNVFVRLKIFLVSYQIFSLSNWCYRLIVTLGDIHYNYFTEILPNISSLYTSKPNFLTCFHLNHKLSVLHHNRKNDRLILTFSLFFQKSKSKRKKITK